GIRAVQSIVVAELTAESAKQGRTRRRSSVLQIDGRFHTASVELGRTILPCSRTSDFSTFALQHVMGYQPGNADTPFYIVSGCRAVGGLSCLQAQSARFCLWHNDDSAKVATRGQGVE
ncbi:hypothetical protein, partial [Ralstonia pseudosolanacearum]|uniref:hypothetical protein n=1 Tax=Ralstonia pseudosolanacearum TaxID=1310165 RepID=UPI002002C3A3